MWHRGQQVNQLFLHPINGCNVNSMLKYRNRRLIPISTRLQNVELEVRDRKSEIETLRYTAGFIAFSLKMTLKKYN